MDRREREIAGRKAENHVARWLKIRGWKVLAERFKVPEGEIDLIVRKKNIIAFVEVKQREHLPTQEDLVTQTNITRVMDAAEVWVGRNFEALGDDFEIRFDLAMIEGRVHPLAKVQYIENAFIGF
ncbi:MAG: YraN family protein [Litorimonas sp.]